ncbi:MAG: ribbon-helix-helix domain-containing protein [Nostochopsis sp.]
MPKYRGKRSNVTFPTDVYEKIADLANQETRTVSQMVVVLCQEALAAREQKSPSPKDKEDK